MALAVIAALSGALAAFGFDLARADTTFTVNSTNDTNGACDATECTLREAITAANATANSGGPDAIEFDIPGSGVKTITLASGLPAITQPVTIDGYSQPGASVNTLAAGTNAVLLIEIDGNNAGFTGGVLRITGGGTTVRGLVINNSPSFSIEIATAGGNTIAGNFIGTDPTGTIHRGRNIGVLVRTGNNTIGGTAPADRNLVHSQPNSSSGAIQFSPGVGDPCSSCGGNVVQGNLIGTNAAGTGTLAVGAFPDHAGSTIGIWISSPTMSATIGGKTSGARNIISGNRQVGIRIDGGRNNTIQGNYIGTNATGTAAIANGFGILMEGGHTTNNTIGGATPGAGNLISGNQQGLWIRAFSGFGESATGNVVQGNLIGTDVNGMGNLGNRESGVVIFTGQNSNNLFGDTDDEAGNTVAFNGGVGVSVRGSGNAVLGNSIFSNRLLGIDLGNDGITPNDPGDGDAGDNNGQNFPVIKSAPVSGGSSTVSGTLNSAANTTFRLEFFSNEACDPHPTLGGVTGNGEGQTYIGTTTVTTDADGNASFGPVSFPVPSGQSVITATATDPSNNTSEFSKCLVPPTARNDSYATNEDAPLTDAAPGVLANDTDPENDPLTAVKVSDPANGSVTLNPNGSFTYTPNANFNGADSFSYKANDGSADGNTATVTITVNPVNDAPSFTIGADQTVDEDSGPQSVPSFATNVSRGPPNEADQTLQFVVTNANNALFSDRPAISPTGNLTYNPVPGANGTALVTVKLRDGGGATNGGDDESDPQTFTITVRAINDAPAANDDDATTDEGTPVDIDVKGNDSDPDGDALTVTGVSDPPHGTATINSDDTVRYVPDPAYSGPDSFDYTISDGNGGTADGGVEITVKEDPAPQLNVFDQQAYEDQEQYFSLGYFEDPGTGTPYTVAVDWGDGSTETFEGEPYYDSYPWFYLNGQTHTYASRDSDPSTPQNDPYTVTVTVTEGDANPTSDTGSFRVEVIQAPPQTEYDSYFVDEEQTLTVDAPGVLANDTDPQGDPLTAQLLYEPFNGTLDLRPDGSFTYTPDADFSFGYDYAYYRACDPGGSCSGWTSIELINEGPAANDDDATTDEDTPQVVNVLDNDAALYDRGNLDPSSVKVLTQPGHGATAVDGATGRITYTPDADHNGADEFAYEVCDEGGTYGDLDPNPRCDTAKVRVTVNPINDPPEATDDAATTGVDTPVVIRVKADDAPGPANEGGQALAVDAITTPPADGTAEIIAEGPDAGEIRYAPDAGYTGPDSFEYEVCDDGEPRECDTATVRVTVSPAPPANDAPVARPDTYDADEDGVLSVDAPGVLGNDTDADDDPLIAGRVSGPAHGTLELRSDGSFTYTPENNFNDEDSFTYEACDDAEPRACSEPVTVTITVNPVNDPPAAEVDEKGTPEDAPLTFPAGDLTANDSPGPYGENGQGLTVASVEATAGTHGSVTLANGEVTYTPEPNYDGPASFTYEVCDDGDPALCDTATVNVTVAALNDEPVADDDAAATDEDTAVAIDVKDGDSAGPANESNQTLVVDGIPAQPAHGAAEIVTTGPDAGKVRYTPDENYNGADEFTYRVCDDGRTNGDPDPKCDTATVRVTVNPLNDRPDAADDTRTTDEDTRANVNVLANDADDGALNPASVRVVRGPDNGTTAVNPDGAITYAPNANFNGTDAFDYEVCDDGEPALCDEATVNVTVAPVNDGPDARPDSYDVDEDGALAVDAPGVLGNDADDDPLAAQLASGPAHGTLELRSDGSFDYTPDADFNGTDTFIYRACDDADPRACSEPVIVTVTVDPVNDAPDTNADDATTPEDTAVSVGVLENDTDVEGDTLTVVDYTQPQNGAVTCTEAGVCTYTPNENFTGTDTFTYKISDGSSDGTATVTVTVTAANDAPAAAPDRYDADEDGVLSVDAPGVLGNDTDADGTSLVAEVVDGPANGTLALDPDGSVEYTPNRDFNGPDSFTYEACDGAEPRACSDPVAVTITVNPVNDAPDAQDDTASTDEDTPLGMDVLRNDADAEGDALTVESFTQPQNGVVTRGPDGTLVYAPNPNFNDADSFTYRASDGGANSDPATVEITVRPVNDAPEANDDADTTGEDTPKDIDVRANDEDPDAGQTLTVTAVSDPAHGTAAVDTGDTVRYAPDRDYNGEDSFTYEVCDSGDPSKCDTATVKVQVTAANDPPKISDIADRTIDANTDTGGIPFTINDPDTPADELVLTASSGNETLVPGSGIVFGGAGENRTVKVTPATDRTGEAEITVKVSDGGAEATDAFVLTVRDVARDTIAPTIECGAADALWHRDDVSIECTASDGGGSGLADPADASFSLSTNVQGGTETTSASTGSREVCDKAGNCATAGPFTGIKVDKKAPTLTCSASPKELWPPNHKLVTVKISVVVRDGGSGAAGFVLTSATSNEPDNGLGDGDTPNDIQGFVIGTPDTSGKVRAERSGTGEGRVYTLSYEGADVVGNSASCNATVTAVPHDQGKK